MRLDPLFLPLRVAADDPTADDATRIIEIDRERVLVLRNVRGMRIRVNVPLDNFLGVAMRLLPGETGADGAVALVLEHRDPALSVPLQLADACDAIADWRSWSRALARPLLVADRDGALRAPFPSLGSLQIATGAPRRRRRTPLRRRRPLMFARRTKANLPIARVVHRGEREIIAPE
jgi:hypothetical protein